MLASAEPDLDAMIIENDLEMKKEVEKRKFHRMAKVHEILEMLEGSQDPRATQKNLALKTSR